MNAKSLFASTILLTLISAAVGSQIAKATEFKDRSGTCYFLKNEKLVLKDNCIISDGSLNGFSSQNLKWSDGIVTKIQFGPQECGDRTYSGLTVDGVCGKRDIRSIKTLKPPRDDMEAAMSCAQLDKKTICWKF
jgi:hypothetical protein